MTDPKAARAQILGGIRDTLRRADETAAAQAVDARLARHPRNTIPARTARPRPEVVDLFVTMVRDVAATVDRVERLEDAPRRIAEWLASHNLPATVKVSLDPALDALPWASVPTVEAVRGGATPDDLTAVTGAFAGIAETGTLMMLSSPETPSTTNFLPDNHIVVMRAADVVGPYEDAWDRMRARGGVPRTVNLITGPSRTGDIEQRIQLGAHGPRRLHIVLVDGPPVAAPGA